MNNLLPQSYANGLNATQVSYPGQRWITTEIEFHNSKVAKLKADQEMQDRIDGVVANQKNTRTELVTALLYRCAVVAAAATSNSSVVLNLSCCSQ